jgi:hypothetical protein
MKIRVYCKTVASVVPAAVHTFYVHQISWLHHVSSASLDLIMASKNMKFTANLVSG